MKPILFCALIIASGFQSVAFGDAYGVGGSAYANGGALSAGKTIPFGLEVNTSFRATDYAVLSEDHTVSFQVNAQAKSGNNQFGFSLFAASTQSRIADSLANHTAARRNAGFSLDLRDIIQMKYVGEGPIPVGDSFRSILANWFIDGGTTAISNDAWIGSIPNRSNVFGSLNIGVAVGPKKISIGDFEVKGNMTAPISIGYQMELQLDENGISQDYGIYVGMDVSVVWGSFSAYFLDTVKLESITFADGSTPEEHGFELVFGSGFTSPNVSTAVPEPGSAVIFLLLFPVVGLYRYRVVGSS